MTLSTSAVAVCRSSASLRLVEQPHVLDGDHGLVGEGLRQRDFLVRELAGRRRGRIEQASAIALPSRSSGTAEGRIGSPSLGARSRMRGNIGIGAPRQSGTGRSGATLSPQAARRRVLAVQRPWREPVVPRELRAGPDCCAATTCWSRSPLRHYDAKPIGRRTDAGRCAQWHRRSVAHPCGDSLMTFRISAVALLCSSSSLLGLVEQARVLQRHAHARGDGAQQAHLGLAESVLALVVLEDDGADDIGRPRRSA